MSLWGLMKEGIELPSTPVLGNSHVIGAVFTGLCVVPAAVLLQYITIQKTNQVFSAIPIDQAHEQNNACSKMDGGAVGLTDNPSALQRWQVTVPEVTALIKDFEDAHQLMGRRHEVIHHDQTANVKMHLGKTSAYSAT